MAKDRFNGFEVNNEEGLDFVDALRTNSIGSSSKSEFDDSHEVKEDDDEDIEQILGQIKKETTDVKDQVEPEVKETEDEPDNVETSTEETVDTNENEVSQVDLLWDAFLEYNGLEKDDETPDSVEGFFDRINKSAEEKSVPKYGNDVIKEMDEYVKNGGDINDYFKTQQTVVDFENIDMDDSDNQKRVLTEFLSRKGFNAQQITKKIDRYLDSDMLQDEATDAYESLIDVLKEEKEALLERQENLKEEQVKAQQDFYTNVVGEIDGISDIRGIKIPEKDKRELMQYIFKVEPDGTTKYQKDYNKSVRNLIESAYFTMKGDALINNAKRSGESQAVKKLKNSLASKQINKSSGRQDFNNDDLFSMLSGQLRN